MGQYEAALNDYNQVIRLDDYTKARTLEYTWVRAFNNRGTVFFELGNYEAALKDYQKAISLNPDWGEPYYNRGILYLTQHKYEMAVEDFTRALQRVREGSRVLNARGLAYEKLGNWTKAREDYSQAISLDSSNGEAFFNLGRVQLHDDELEAAIPQLSDSQTIRLGKSRSRPQSPSEERLSEGIEIFRQEWSFLDSWVSFSRTIGPSTLFKPIPECRRVAIADEH